MNKRRAASAISGGIFIVSLGELLITGWWWPGILIAIGLSSGAELIFRGRVLQGIGSLAFFCAIPLLVAAVQRTDIPWTVVGGLFLMGGGVITLVKAFFLRD
jgi:hypothetical protein